MIATFAVYPKKFTAIIVVSDLHIRLSKVSKLIGIKLLSEFEPIVVPFFIRIIIQTAAYTTALIEEMIRILLKITVPVDTNISAIIPVTGLGMCLFVYFYAFSILKRVNSKSNKAVKNISIKMSIPID